MLEDQQKIFDEIVSVSDKLSDKLDEIYKRLDSRLASMAWEQHRISDNLKELIWAEWRSCFSMYHYALAPNRTLGTPPLFNPQTLRFETFENVRAVVEQRGEQISACLKTVREAMDSLSATQWFGAFLDAKRALNPESIPDPGMPADNEEVEKWRGIEQRHWEDVVEPAKSIVSDWAKRNGIPASTLLQLQTWRISDVFQLAKEVSTSRRLEWVPLEVRERFRCDSTDKTGSATRELVCGTSNPDETAERLMDFAINVNISLELADWMAVLSQVAGLYGNGGRFAESLEDLATFGGISPGEEITRKAAAMMALAIAYYARIYGGITALALAEDILSGRADEHHSTALRNNPYLAENTALILLLRKRPIWTVSLRPSWEDRYLQALLYARSQPEEANRFMPLEAFFDQDHAFTSNDEGKIGLSVKIGNAEVFLPLPPPTRLAKGQFILPPRYHVLTNRQDLFIDVYADYLLGSDSALARVVLQR